MTRPQVPVTIRTEDGRTATVLAMFDSGSQRTFIREDALPPGATFHRREHYRVFPTAGPRRLRAIGTIFFQVDIGKRRIESTAWIAPRLPIPFLIGAGAMQEWDISITNQGGRTRVHVGLDVRDPEANLVI